jgi:hypothetical protein
MDPNCSESPYQEPAASLNGAGIAVIVICCSVAVATCLFFFYKWSKSKQEKRVKYHFAKKVVQNMSFVGSHENITPANLEKEFDRIDSTGVADGSISREELKEFLSVGGTGMISDADFNILFASLDIHDRGNVNFLEFCAFLAKCEDEIDTRTYRRDYSMRQGLVKTVSLRLSQNIQVVKEEEDEEADE